MPSERKGDLLIVPIDFPTVQLQYRLADAGGQVLPGEPVSDPPEKWSELKRRLFLSEDQCTAAEAILRRGDTQPLGIQRFQRP